MADTHINAFYGAVDEAKVEVEQAKDKLERAEVALKSHPDYKESKKSEPEPIAEEVEEPESETVKVKVKSKK